jgi:hypothetical protein
MTCGVYLTWQLVGRLWAVEWLEKQMVSVHHWPIVPTLSNESPHIRVFQRTLSAQEALSQARKLLTVCGPAHCKQAR